MVFEIIKKKHYYIKITRHKHICDGMVVAVINNFCFAVLWLLAFN